ncbi:MAG: hypothetical protein WC675_05875 [Patescibacteria group bacterium]|jgi:hypothetical protein
MTTVSLVPAAVVFLFCTTGWFGAGYIQWWHRRNAKIRKVNRKKKRQIQPIALVGWNSWKAYWAESWSDGNQRGRTFLYFLVVTVLAVAVQISGIVTAEKVSKTFAAISWYRVWVDAVAFMAFWSVNLTVLSLFWWQKLKPKDKEKAKKWRWKKSRLPRFAQSFIAAAWSFWLDSWGANALRGQYITACVGASLVIVDSEMGNTINFDQYKTFSQVLIILPLILPAAGLCAMSEGFGKFVLTFGTSLIFGGYPGFMIKGLIGLGDDPNKISSLSVAVAAVTMIIMYWSFFQIGHLSRFFLYMCTNIFRPADFPKSASKVIWMLVFAAHGSLSRTTLTAYPASDWVALFGKYWYMGKLSADSLWRKIEAVIGGRMGKLVVSQLFKRIDLETAHIELLDYIRGTIKKALADRKYEGAIGRKSNRRQLEKWLTSLNEYLEPVPVTA